jgi:hypothetical protein
MGGGAMKFEHALGVAVEELKEELVWNEVSNFLNYLWTETIVKELQVEKWDFEKFEKAIMAELEARKWDIRYFRSCKNEPISNLFKKIVKLIAKEEGTQLSNDSLSRILNAVRKQYTAAGKLVAGIYPPIAFRERRKWGIYEYLGDSNSCFLREGCNEGNVYWLIQEYELYKRAFFTVFYYKQGNDEGWARCWVYKVNDTAIYITNFYSKYFEIKSESFKYPIVRLLRRIFGMSENVKFSVGKNAPLPIYLNGDGIVIYEPSSWGSSSEVLDAIGELYSKCLWCGDEVKVKHLYRYSETVDYDGRRVRGLIVCEDCEGRLDDMVICEDCGEYVDRDEARYIDGYGYVCYRCFDEDWFFCDECDEPHRRDYMVFTPDDRVLCEDCASRLGTRCAVCGEFFYYDKEDEDEVGIQQYEITYRARTETVYICDRCAERHLRSYTCEQCGETVQFLVRDFRANEVLRDVVRLGLCGECYQERKARALELAFENKVHLSLFAWSDPTDRIIQEIISE